MERSVARFARGLLGNHEREEEAMVTTDKGFKKLVRARSRATGQSYTAARHTLLAEMTVPDPRTLVQRLVHKTTMPDAMRGLIGGVTATELRSSTVSPPAFAALAEGIDDPNPRVRWWCIQALDHISSAAAIGVIVGALDDPVPRVRRNGAHALGCAACKPEWDGRLPHGVEEKLQLLATDDPNAKVRAEAGRAVVCTAARRQARRMDGAQIEEPLNFTRG
jgi:HEAT repeat protein